jgi:hypothetical protein
MVIFTPLFIVFVSLFFVYMLLLLTFVLLVLIFALLLFTFTLWLVAFILLLGAFKPFFFTFTMLLPSIVEILFSSRCYCAYFHTIVFKLYDVVVYSLHVYKASIPPPFSHFASLELNILTTIDNIFS